MFMWLLSVMWGGLRMRLVECFYFYGQDRPWGRPYIVSVCVVVFEIILFLWF